MLALLALWLFCLVTGGVAHLACHVEEDTKRPQPTTPHPCLVCRSLVQSGRCDIQTLTQKSLAPVFVTYYIFRPADSHPAALKAAHFLSPNRGPPSLLPL